MSEPSDNYSCKLQAKWDFSNSSDTGKHTESRETYRFNTRRYLNRVDGNYGFDVIETKNKIRGNGKSLVLRFESTDDKDFELLGWAMEVTAPTID